MLSYVFALVLCFLSSRVLSGYLEFGTCPIVGMSGHELEQRHNTQHHYNTAETHVLESHVLRALRLEIH